MPLFSLTRNMLRRDKSIQGSTAVEVALLAPVFFLILIGLVELSLLFTAQQLLENAAFNASRLAKSGYAVAGETQAQLVTSLLDNELQSYGSMIDVTQVTTSAESYNSFNAINQAGQGISGFGSASQIVVYTVNYPWKLFTPMLGEIIGTWNSITHTWQVNLTSQIVVRNEPYD